MARLTIKPSRVQPRVYLLLENGTTVAYLHKNQGDGYEVWCDGFRIFSVRTLKDAPARFTVWAAAKAVKDSTTSKESTQDR